MSSRLDVKIPVVSKKSSNALKVSRKIKLKHRKETEVLKTDMDTSFSDEITINNLSTL